MAVMLIALGSLFGLYVLTPGRRIYTLGQVRKLVLPMNLSDVVAAIDAAIAQDRRVLEMDATWRAGGPSSTIRERDGVVDRTLGMIEQLISHYAQGGNDTAAEIHAKLFPVSVGHHTHLPYFDQSAANERVLSILEGAEYQVWLDANGLRPLIQSLRAAQDAFAADLDSRDAGPSLTWPEVKKAHEVGQDMYLQVVAMVTGLFARDEATRSQLLQPVWQQNLAIQAYRRRRRTAADIDPDSGEPMDEQEGMPGEVAGEAPAPAADSGE